MHSFDQCQGVFRIHIRMDAVPQIEDMARPFAIAGKDLTDTLANPLR